MPIVLVMVATVADTRKLRRVENRESRVSYHYKLVDFWSYCLGYASELRLS